MFCLYKGGRYEETSTVEEMCSVYIKEEDTKMENVTIKEETSTVEGITYALNYAQNSESF